MSGTQNARRLLIAGGSGGSALASSFERAAAQLDWQGELYDVAMTQSSSRIVNAAAWRLAGRLPPYPLRLSEALREGLAKPGDKVLLTTGLAPVRAADVVSARNAGARTLHFSSDDPWNPGYKAAWHLRALTEYDVVFTPRRSNEAELIALGCRAVRYLPFGYDPVLVPPCNDAVSPMQARPVLFVGGADAERARFVRAFRRAGGDIALVGGFWDRLGDLAHLWLGHRPPQVVAELTRAAGINLILVRRANRDGHTMRSFEAAALGGCLLVEDTSEHRAIFGPDGEAVRYFDRPGTAAALAAFLLADPAERQRLAQAVRARIVEGGNTYADRLAEMLVAVAHPQLEPRMREESNA